MTAVKIKNLFIQLIIAVLALGINIIAITPIYLILSGDFADFVEFLLQNYSMILLIPTMLGIFGISFALNRLLFRVKGKKTDETYLAWYTEKVVSGIDYDSFSDRVKVTYTPITYPKFEERRTVLGWIATFLTFIVFPMRLVSVIMAFAALFTERIFVTHRQLNDEMIIGKGAVVTHTLFDFVILPTAKSAPRNHDKHSVIFVVAYVAEYAAVNFAAIFIYEMFLVGTGAIIAFFATLALSLSAFILMIKYCVLICRNYEKKTGLKYLLNLSILLAVIIAVNLLSILIK